MIDRTALKANLSDATRAMLARNSNQYNVLYSAADSLATGHKAHARALIASITGICCAGASADAHAAHRAALLDDLAAATNMLEDN
jgi:hypothetical protein